MPNVLLYPLVCVTLVIALFTVRKYLKLYNDGEVVVVVVVAAFVIPTVIGIATDGATKDDISKKACDAACSTQGKVCHTWSIKDYYTYNDPPNLSIVLKVNTNE